MRILHLIHSEGVYGAELILLYLAREQQRQGHEVAVGSMRDPGTPQTSFEQLAAAYGLKVIALRVAPRPTPAVQGALLSAARELQSQVLHSHGYKANIILGLLPRRARPPMLTTLHGWTANRGLSALRLYELLDRWAIRRLDATVIVSRTMLDLPAVRSLAPAKRHVIENGIPSRATRLADLAAQGVPALPQALMAFVRRAPTLLSIGRLSPEKGFGILLEAFARARVQRTDAQQLLIVGEGPQRDALTRQITALGLNEHVQLAGYVPGADRLLSEAAGLVMSSLTEGMPLVLMEALQCDVPIVATAVGAIPELLRDGQAGMLVPPHDGGALSAALTALMDGRARPPPGVTAAIAEHYSSERMAQEYLRLYQTIT
jgi:glycosyltransferase involved in cell wall biosynthesis